mmetsp:Transcript_1691/g.2262  ORF Transcript_1691/g.2262 Transcript_1691/m.2262 type:complete len:119 (+) Transcript_1691:346-702(+)
MPSEIGKLTNLIQFMLHVNRMSGLIPSEIGYLTKLSELHLGNNQLSGVIPSQIDMLSKLAILDLTNNPDITGDLNHLCNTTTNAYGALNYRHFSADGTFTYEDPKLTDWGVRCDCCTA